MYNHGDRGDSMPTLREVRTPYTINPNDESLTSEPLLIRRNGEEWIVVAMRHEDYQRWLAQNPTPSKHETDFERNRAAFKKLLPDLLKQHEGQWIAIVNEQAAAFATSANQVLEKVGALGDVPLYIQEVRAQPRIYKMTSRRIAHSTSIHEI
jgi:hypothetical protein